MGGKARYLCLGEEETDASPSHCSTEGCSKQGEHLRDQGTQSHPGMGLICQDPAQSQHQHKIGQQAS